jgi:hypothetical protein
MRLSRTFVIASLLVAAIPLPIAAGVAAKSLQGLFSSDECEVVPEILGAWTGPGVTYSVREADHEKTG